MEIGTVRSLARVVELVDSLASGASARKGVRVRLPPRAPRRSKVRFAPTIFYAYVKKFSSARSLSTPFQIEATVLGSDFGPPWELLFCCREISVLAALSKKSRDFVR